MARTKDCIIGVDPGLNLTGYGVVECRADEVKLLEAGVIRLPRSQGNNLPARLESLLTNSRESFENSARARCAWKRYTATRASRLRRF